MADAPALPIRKRMRRREIPGGLRFVTFSCQRRLPLLGRAAIRDVLTAALILTRTQHRFELFAWVVMPEHVHLMVRPRPESKLHDALRSLKTSVAKRVVSRWMDLRTPVLEQLRTGDKPVRFWQKGGGFDRNLRDMEEFCREVRCIHRNPVTRGLVERPEDWKWSSARWWMGMREGEVECDPPPGDPKPWEGWRGYA
ncbi:MAG: transposase [Phycisphaeraceae bacterium]|nr:transposase [Phycisphaeraceae bacterium]